MARAEKLAKEKARAQLKAALLAQKQAQEASLSRASVHAQNKVSSAGGSSASESSPHPIQRNAMNDKDREEDDDDFTNVG